MNLNKVILVGRLTKNPELRSTQSGISVATVGLATNRTFTTKSKEKQQQTEFHNLVFWGRLAEVANQYCTKGALLLVVGRIEKRNWNAKDGSKRSTTEIVVEEMQLGPKPQNGRDEETEEIDPGEVLGGDDDIIA